MQEYRKQAAQSSAGLLRKRERDKEVCWDPTLHTWPIRQKAVEGVLVTWVVGRRGGLMGLIGPCERQATGLVVAFYTSCSFWTAVSRVALHRTHYSTQDKKLPNCGQAILIQELL